MITRILYDIVAHIFNIGDVFSENDLYEKLKKNNIDYSERQMNLVLSYLVKDNVFKIIKKDNEEFKKICEFSNDIDTEDYIFYQVMNNKINSETEEMIIEISKALNNGFEKCISIIDSKNMTYYLDKYELCTYISDFANKLENFGIEYRNKYSYVTRQPIYAGLISQNNINHNQNLKKWDRWYSIAKEYYREHGDLNIKLNKEINGRKIGRWINNQRKARKNNNGNRKITQEQIDKLNEIGMIW